MSDLSRSRFLTTAGALGAAVAAPVGALADPTPLRVIAFASPNLLPVYAATAKGFFAKENLSVTVANTPGSVYQFQHFAAGDFEIASTAMDNIIAYDAGEGEAPLASPADFVAILGADNGFLRFMGRPEIGSVADLKGKTLAVDALSTGYAFVLRAMLAAGGLHDGDFSLLPLGSSVARLKALEDGSAAATIISAPFDQDALAAGMKLLGDVYKTIGPYQGGMTAVRRSWLRSNRAAALAYVRGFRAGLAWSFDPANRDEAAQLLVTQAKLQPKVADLMLSLIVGPGGMDPHGRIDVAGVRTVLALRATYATPSKPLGTPSDYVDASLTA